MAVAILEDHLIITKVVQVAALVDLLDQTLVHHQETSLEEVLLALEEVLLVLEVTNLDLQIQGDLIPLALREQEDHLVPIILDLHQMIHLALQARGARLDLIHLDHQGQEIHLGHLDLVDHLALIHLAHLELIPLEEILLAHQVILMISLDLIHLILRKEPQMLKLLLSCIRRAYLNMLQICDNYINVKLYYY